LKKKKKGVSLKKKIRRKKMEFNVKFRGIEEDKRAKEYLEKRFSFLKKSLKDAGSVSFVFSRDSDGINLECNLRSKNFNIYCKEKAKDMLSVIDLLKDNLKSQLRKKKEKIVERKRKSVDVNLLEVEEGEKETVEIEELDSKPMSREEAILQLKELNRPFLAFLDEETGEMAVAYKKGKSAYGIIFRKIK
jgi:ribosomal subunit interface protein